ncbi:MAG: hypothetical protein JWO31_2505 [Phycisphaerales bacterium]|nr:hypothetical protein [Phycisphaerales bacterium]
MTYRSLCRFARPGRSLAVVAVATAALIVAGCDSKGTGGAPPTTGPAAAAGSGTVGVLDARRVIEVLQWDAEQKRDAELAASDANRELGGFLQQLEAAVAEKRKALISAAKLTTAQADKLSAGDIEALPLTLEQKTDYRSTIQSANLYQQQARQVHQNVLTGRQQAVDRMYTEVVKPAARRAAQAAGVHVVLLKQAIFYSDAAAEITDRVIDDLQKAPPPRTFPPFPKLNLPQVKLDEPPPATQPATAPAAPLATAPPTTRPNR